MSHFTIDAAALKDFTEEEIKVIKRFVEAHFDAVTVVEVKEEPACS